MDFVVDKVSEDSFYENLLLGLPKIIENNIGIISTYLVRYSQVTHSDICAWEVKQGILLPEDLRCFYASTDGFLFKWSYNVTEEEADAVVGKIEINPLSKLCLVTGYEIHNESKVTIDGVRYDLKLTADSKVFELVKTDNLGKVVLVYINTRFNPTVWLITGSMKFYFLADDFETYLRMAVANLGIPNWQFSFTPEGVPQWTEEIFLIMAPHLLPLNKSVESMRKGREVKDDEKYPDVPLNKIDISIFKLSPKTLLPPANVPPPELLNTPTKLEKKKPTKTRPANRNNQKKTPNSRK